jgi:WD40 repeat protein
LLAAGDRNGAVKIWDTASGRLSRTLAGHDVSVRSVAYSDAGNRLASAGDDRLVKLWDTANGALAGVLRGHTDIVNQVAFAAGGHRRLVSCSGSGPQPGEVKLWNVTTRQELLTLRGHASKVTCVAISRDHQHWASAAGDGTVRIWDAPQSGQP